MNRILYYSHCYVFGGSERLLVNLIKSHEINNCFDVQYAYARNRDYQKGVEREIPDSVCRHPLRILDNHNLFYRIDRSGMSKFLAICLKVPFALLERTGIYAFHNFLRLLFFFRKMKPDLLHINNGGYPAAHSCLVAVFSARAAGVNRIVLSINNLAIKQSNLLEKLVDSYIDRHVDQFVTASSEAGKMLIENRQFSPTKIIQIYNGISAEKPHNSREAVLAGFCIPTQKFIIVTVAFLTERKGQICLLKALKCIRDSNSSLYDDIALFLVGDGEDRSLIERYIAENSMSGSVFLAGQRDDYFDFIHGADLFVLPSLRDEDMPLVILSAMSCGKAIISTRVAGIVEQIRDGVDGILLDPGDTVALANAIMRFQSNREEGASCGASARARFAECFTLDRFLQNYLALYDRLLHG